jgi:hypothetical protein
VRPWNSFPHGRSDGPNVLGATYGGRRQSRWLRAADGFAVLSRRPAQLALRISSTSVPFITPGTGCSITSTATVSTTGVTGGFTFRAAFFTGAGLGFALATVRFAGAALAALRALPRLAELRSFARFCTFDAFLRLAMIRPALVGASQRIDARSTSPGNQTIELSTDGVVSAAPYRLKFTNPTLGFASLRWRW